MVLIPALQLSINYNKICFLFYLTAMVYVAIIHVFTSIHIVSQNENVFSCLVYDAMLCKSNNACHILASSFNVIQNKWTLHFRLLDNYDHEPLSKHIRFW